MNRGFALVVFAVANIAACTSLETAALQTLENELMVNLSKRDRQIQNAHSCELVALKIEHQLQKIETARNAFESLDLWIEYLGTSALLFAASEDDGEHPYEAVQALEDLYKTKRELGCSDPPAG